MTRDPLRISSRANEWYQRFRDAIARHDDEIVLEGPKQIDDALSLGWKPIALASDGSASPAHPPTLVFDPALFRTLSETRHSQGVLGLFPRAETALDELLRRPGVVVALDGVQDPGNVGTIVRLAAAFEAAGVVLTEGCADPFGQKAIRASAGTILEVPLCRTTREALQAGANASRRGFAVAEAGGDPDGRLDPSAILVLGAEGAGVSDELRREARRLAVRISPRVESLNVAAAAAILLSRAYDAKG